MQRPEGYSAEAVEQVAAAYPGEEGEMRPNIIVIMNESFADLRTVGNFETNEDYMPYFRSLQQELMCPDNNIVLHPHFVKFRHCLLLNLSRLRISLFVRQE